MKVRDVRAALQKRPIDPAVKTVLEKQQEEIVELKQQLMEQAELFSMLSDRVMELFAIADAMRHVSESQFGKEKIKKILEGKYNAVQSEEAIGEV